MAGKPAIPPGVQAEVQKLIDEFNHANFGDEEAKKNTWIRKSKNELARL